MTKTSLTANQPRFSIRTYSLGAASVLLAYACLAAGPVAHANTGTNTNTSTNLRTVQASTSSSTGQEIPTQITQPTTPQTGTKQTTTSTTTSPSNSGKTDQTSHEKIETGTSISAGQQTQLAIPETNQAKTASSPQATPTTRDNQTSTVPASSSHPQTSTPATSSFAISQKTNTTRTRLTTQTRTASTRSSSTSALGDDYPYTAVDAIDPWRLYTRQCTSFVAFRLSKVNGFEIPPAYGNADVWGSRARQEGYRVDMTPAVGAVAWWTSPMHVAWVSSIQGDMVEIEEYNYGTRYTYNRRLIHKNSVSGYIHFKDLAGSPVSQTSPAPTQTHTSGLANSGTYTFTKQAPIKNEAKQSSTTLDYYYAGESVRYDRVLTADGYQWISYLSYSGQRRYIPIKQVEASPAPQQATQTNKNLPASGTYTFSSKAIVRNRPSQSASEITYYGTGSSVRYDRVVTAEGRQWISYVSYSGARRYIAIP